MRKKSLTRQIGVLFSGESCAKLIRLTDAQETTMSEFIRQIVETKLNETNDQEEPHHELND
jgi:hypothetical protein